jgi:hypothetical protein
MRVGRGDGSTDDADVCGLRTVRHARPEAESMYVYMCGYGCLKGMYIRTRGLQKYQKDTNDVSSIRAASSSEPSHMRERLSGWYVTTDPPVCEVLGIA